MSLFLLDEAGKEHFEKEARRRRESRLVWFVRLEKEDKAWHLVDAVGTHERTLCCGAQIDPGLEKKRNLDPEEVTGLCEKAIDPGFYWHCRG